MKCGGLPPAPGGGIERRDRGFVMVELAFAKRQARRASCSTQAELLANDETRQGHQHAGSADRRPDQKALRPVGHGDVIRP
jgi:hypothetical protein